ncbi:MAG: hypothetical protein EXS31_08705 [Pedosphaera sp.]|nr:hypothetical protein [Pedosphaera sp.]
MQRLVLVSSRLARRGRCRDWLALAFVCLSFASSFAAAPAPGSSAASKKKPTIADLARQLSDSDKVIRREAAHQLSLLGAEARAALPELIKALDDSQQQVWLGAVVALAQIGPDAKDSISALLRGLNRTAQREGRQVWYRSSFALGRIGVAAVPALIDSLKSSEALVRAGAAQALGWIGTDAGPALPLLAPLLNDSDEQVRQLSGEALARIGSESVPHLLAFLSSSESRLREESARSLSHFGSAAAEHAPRVLAQLGAETDGTARARQIECLSSFSSTEPQFVQLTIDGLIGSDDNVRHAAVNALVRFDSARVTVPEMKKLLASEDPTKRERAASVLERLGPKARDAMAELIQEARRSVSARSASARALTTIGASALPPLLLAAEGESIESIGSEHWIVRALADMGPENVEELAAALARPGAAVRLAALEVLLQLGKEASAATTAVTALLKAEPPRVRARALVTLLATTRQTSILLPHIQAAMRDADAGVRVAATAAVAELGSAGEPCVPFLIDALRDFDRSVRLNGAKALGILGAKAGAAVPALSGQLSTNDPEFRTAIIETLGRIGPAAAETTPALVTTIESGPGEQRLAALRALGQFGAKAVAAGNVVQTMMRDPSAETRAAAFKTASRIAREDDSVLSMLSGGLDDAEPVVRIAAAEALGQFGEKAREQAPKLFAMLKRSGDRPAALDSLRQIKSQSIPLFMEALKNEDAAVRVFACESLTKLGPAAAEAVPALREVENDSNNTVRRQARAAIKAIEKVEAK